MLSSADIYRFFESHFTPSQSKRSVEHLNREDEITCFYHTEKALIFPPFLVDNQTPQAAAKTHESIDEMLQNTRAAFQAEAIDITQYELLFMVAETGPTLGLVPMVGKLSGARDHFVVLHYQPSTQTAQLIDSRAQVYGQLYNTAPLQTALQAGLTTVGLTLNAPLEIQYLGVQEDTSSCGLFATRVIQNLAAGQALDFTDLSVSAPTRQQANQGPVTPAVFDDEHALDVVQTAKHHTTLCLQNIPTLIEAVQVRASIKRYPEGLPQTLSPQDFKTLLRELSQKYDYIATEANGIPRPQYKHVDRSLSGYYLHDPERLHGTLQDHFSSTELQNMGFLKAMLYAAVLYYAETNSGLMEMAARAATNPQLTDSMLADVGVQMTQETPAIRAQIHAAIIEQIKHDLTNPHSIISTWVNEAENHTPENSEQDDETLGEQQVKTQRIRYVEEELKVFQEEAAKRTQAESLLTPLTTENQALRQDLTQALRNNQTLTEESIRLNQRLLNAELRQLAAQNEQAASTANRAREVGVLYHHLALIEAAGHTLQDAGETIAAEAALRLKTNLEADIQDYLTRPLCTLTDFQARCQAHIEAEQDVLVQHPGWKEMLGNFLIGLLSIGTALVLNKLLNNEFLFFNRSEPRPELTDAKHALQKIGGP